eukprot:comp16856_c0_seq1/m.15326 comp16856_c0_seq1/g.15326  ORF comp16856_c0_seq1/g.15326 comp16856_c0_seq1/m.15326 type:complete len:218 (-) comp16856_c0_seq1:259-912(-)
MEIDKVAHILGKSLPKVDEMVRGVTDSVAEFLGSVQSNYVPKAQTFVSENSGVLVALGCTAVTLYWALFLMEPKRADRTAPTPAKPSVPARAATPQREEPSRESTPRSTRASSRARSVSVEPSSRPPAPANPGPKSPLVSKLATTTPRAPASPAKPGMTFRTDYTREELEDMIVSARGEQQVGINDVLRSLGLPLGTDKKADKIQRILDRQAALQNS